LHSTVSSRNGGGGHLPSLRSFLPEWRELGANAIYIFDCEVGLLHAGRQIRPGQPAELKGKAGMVRLIKVVFILGILGFAALTGYAYLVDMAPESRQITVPVTLDAN
jgi:hypothetical protein